MPLKKATKRRRSEDDVAWSVKDARSLFCGCDLIFGIDQGFGSGSGSARIRMFLPCPDLDPHKFADPDPDPGKKVRK